MANMISTAFGAVGAGPVDWLKGPLPPLMHPSTTLEHAVRENTLGVGYASGGFLVFYYLGVSKVLQQLGIIKPGFVKTAGTSIGSLAQGVDHPGMGTHEEMMKRGVKFCENCRKNRMCFSTLDERYAELVAGMMPENVTEVISGNACIVMSFNNNRDPVGGSVCSFNSRQEVIDAIRASCYVPGWSGPAPGVPFRGKTGLDGVFTQLLPCPPNVTYCIKVSPVPPFRLRETIEGILDPKQLRETLGLLGTATLSILNTDPVGVVTRFIRRNTLYTINLRSWLSILSTYQFPLPDIYPGKYAKSPFAPEQWVIHLLVPPNEDDINKMYAMGRADGLGWAKAQGWTIPPELEAAARG